MTTFVYNPLTGECRWEEDPPKRADLVAVVRCKDCYHYSVVNQPYDESWCSVMEDSVPTDGYCYHGRRREATE